MADSATKKMKILSSTMLDWSQFPEELLHLISKNLENNCFDVVHARSVCSSWRSSFPFPSSLLRPCYSLPAFSEFPRRSKDLCTLEKVHLFHSRVLSPTTADAEYLFGGISRDESEDLIELSSPLQCSVKVKIPGTEPTLINMLDCQILSLGHQYKMIGRNFRRVAILPLDKEGKRGEFVVLLNNYNSLLVLESAKMRWRQLTNIPDSLCQDLVTFRGRFYATFFHSSKIVVIDPYSLEVTLLFPSPQEPTVHCLVPSGSDELFLVEVTVPTVGLLDISRSKCKVSRLDEADTWVEVSDLGDRILFIGQLGNVSCSAKELPHGCGLSGNSILFTNQPGNESFAYKYGVHTEDAEDDPNCLRYSRENRVILLNKSFPAIAFRVER
ncbi:hypothetical protein ISN44_As09g003820 [Arabidopsis suecica]|uniref:KIB1-4 beta-propeller domain-containing protein n=1 Tax=Arabidopsis suecica TaxID=45249 RepID=A0A8T2AET7_ARASU|nr:hypothetical protein ISN44_As09g003820 [Arabidopsis suecica]